MMKSVAVSPRRLSFDCRKKSCVIPPNCRKEIQRFQDLLCFLLVWLVKALCEAVFAPLIAERMKALPRFVRRSRSSLEDGVLLLDVTGGLGIIAMVGGLCRKINSLL